jgi:hypothetical protein
MQVLDRDACMGVTLDADTCQESDLLTRLLAEQVLTALADRYDAGPICLSHISIVPASRGTTDDSHKLSLIDASLPSLGLTTRALSKQIGLKN